LLNLTLALQAFLAYFRGFLIFTFQNLIQFESGFTKETLVKLSQDGNCINNSH